MIDWTYNPEQYSETSFALIPEGDYRCRIEEVIEKTFNSGRSGLELTLAISGQNSKVWFYLVFNRDDIAKTNQRIGELLKCFGIQDNNLNHYSNWVGKVGACRIKHEDYNGEKTAKVKFLIAPDRAAKLNLPAWKEPANSQKNATVAPSDNSGFIPVSDDDVPF